MALLFAKRWIPAWYLSIAIGFVLLAIRAYVAGASIAAVLLRILIAAGFATLAWDQNRRRR